MAIEETTPAVEDVTIPRQWWDAHCEMVYDLVERMHPEAAVDLIESLPYFEEITGDEIQVREAVALAAAVRWREYLNRRETLLAQWADEREVFMARYTEIIDRQAVLQFIR